jgi:RNA polymerase sigma-70 factor (ECF subfamily)
MKNLSDIEIIDSVRRGNSSDYALLVERYKNKAFSMLKRLLKNQMDAEEALQDSFLKAYNSLNNFKGESKFSTWFYRIVYNTAITIINAKKRQTEKEMISIDEEFEIESYDNEIYSKAENVNKYVIDMVEKLPPRNALIIILYYIDDMSLHEISQVMGLSLVNVKVMLHRSRTALKELVVKHNLQEELI